MAKEFHKTDAQIALVITMTLLFRPVGGFVFGLMADRYGRRLPLMINIGFFAVAEILTGLAPVTPMLLIVRALFGVVMGGNWGVGTSLAMEGAPKGKRGMLSGLLQEGYAAGNVLAALCFLFLFGRVGWRPLFFLGQSTGDSAGSVYPVPGEGVDGVAEGAYGQLGGAGARGSARTGSCFSTCVVFMTMMMFASHGTQDMYPTFLQREWHFTPQRRAVITAISGVGAILGGIIFGHFSDVWGRRKTIIIAFVLGALVVPLWAYAPNQALLVLGAFLIQFMVQGAWGVIPAHLAELSPDSVRGLLPGFSYQTAGIIASSVVYIEAVYAQRTSYATAMALTAVSVFALASIMAAVGRERRGHTFGS